MALKRGIEIVRLSEYVRKVWDGTAADSEQV
jgi:hypothetical protein